MLESNLSFYVVAYELLTSKFTKYLVGQTHEYRYMRLDEFGNHKVLFRRRQRNPRVSKSSFNIFFIKCFIFHAALLSLRQY